MSTKAQFLLQSRARMDLKSKIERLLECLLGESGHTNVQVRLVRPKQLEHGDYTTMVAMTLAKEVKQKPFVIAQTLVDKIAAYKAQQIAAKPIQILFKSNQKGLSNKDIVETLEAIEKVTVAPPGFINITLSTMVFSRVLDLVLNNDWTFFMGQNAQRSKYMVEFAHPNTHKAFHIGHLRNITTGESIVRLLESQGHTVIRANYQGDVGMHIAKCLYGILHNKELKKLVEKYSSSESQTSREVTVKNENESSRLRSNNRLIAEKVEFLGKAYAQGSKGFEESDEVKKQVGEINKQIYAKDPAVWELYQKTRQWSLDYFESIYKRVGSHFDRYYFESETFESGKNNVQAGLKKGIFEESDGAIIFPGEKYGLHNRVFITSEGNATYEGKDMGLAPLQFKEYHSDKIIHVVGPEQAGYFQVVFEALAQMFPETKGKEYHLVYGWVKLKHGKMSSRTGNVVLGEWLIDEAKKNVNIILQKNESKYSKEEQSSFVKTSADKETIAETAAIAAVKYSFLKVGTKQEIAFDINESVTFEGDSGPYLQYTYARCKSVVRKAKSGSEGLKLENSLSLISQANLEEKNILQIMVQFPEVVRQAAEELSPSVVCAYLYRLASSYNVFYNKHSILQSANQAQTNFRLALTQATADIIKQGLFLLGINVLEQM